MSQEIFEQLVDNAIEFLNRAIDDLPTQPKHSVIAFYTGLELFIKARLMREHWSLIVSRRSEPDLDAFLKGDFVSVGLEEAATRLDKVVKTGLTASELRTFQGVKQHRNKLVHFFHEAAKDTEKEEFRRVVLKEHLSAWHALNRLITERWEDVFKPWSGQFQKIEDRLREYRVYLDAAYQHAGPKIAALRKQGKEIHACPACGYEADTHEPGLNSVYVTDCLVCGLRQRAIRIECTRCSDPLIFLGDGFARCHKCDRSYDPEALANVLDDGGHRHMAAMEGDYTELGNCSLCDGYHTIATLTDGSHVCASCLAEFEQLQFCEWCGDPNSGDMRLSNLAGCNHCEGQAGQYRDD